MNQNDKSKFFLDLLGNSIITGLIISFIYYTYIYQPVVYVFFVAEDSWSEYATFLFWFFTFCILSWALLKYREFRKPGYFLFALIAFVIAMEEISWGQRIFHITTPEFFQTRNYQRELTFHNLARPDHYYVYIGTIIILGSIALPVLATMFSRFQKFCNGLGIPIVPVRCWPFFILSIYLFEYYRYFEFHRLSNIKLSYLSELAEFSLALAVSAMTLNLVLRLSKKTSVLPSIVSTIGLITVVIICTVPLIYFFRDCHTIKSNLNNLSCKQYPRKSMYQQSDLLFCFIDRHPKYLKKETRYYHGLVLLKLGRNNAAREILKKAIREQEQRRLEGPENPEVYRDAGRIFHVLDRTIDAKKAYLQAIKLDQERLKVTIDPDEEAIYRWSLGKTIFAIGKKEAADEQFQQAIKITRFNQIKGKISRWIDYEQKNVVRLLPSEMANIDIDLTRIPEDQYPKDSKTSDNAPYKEETAFLWVNLNE